ncbi:hypothetical protein [Leptospira kanakyensis]|uniref:hypothetical protein n=1 Tax=Leptospira kanakyensis TaxID=2484968 RepID=UPI00223CD947|nr:hypothetical protein [Leptospira kanakyensis]MCW7471764.1 hypothetical protein [Leptospira kanakyensis]
MSNEKYFQGEHIYHIGTPFLYQFTNSEGNIFYTVGGILSDTDVTYLPITEKIESENETINAEDKKRIFSDMKEKFLRKAKAEYIDKLLPDKKEAILKTYSYSNPFSLSEFNLEDSLFHMKSHHPNTYFAIRPYLNSEYFIEIIKITDII